MLTISRHQTGGYGQSKFVSEVKVREARRRGLFALIFRPGRVWAHSRTGFSNPNDFLVSRCGLTLLLGSENLTLCVHRPRSWPSRAWCSWAWHRPCHHRIATTWRLLTL